MGQLQNRMEADLKIGGYSPSTRKVYLIYARKFVEYHRRSPDEMGANQVREYLLHLIEHRHISQETVRQVRSALHFLYSVTLNRPVEVGWLPAGRRHHRLPVVLSGTEVAALLQAVRHRKYRTILSTMYAAGLRITEGCLLLPEDIHSKRKVIHVRSGKGNIDRYTVLSPRLLHCLRGYWRKQRPNSHGYLFPGKTLLGHACPDTVRIAFRKAADEAGIKKAVTPHVLRHCFATHMLECGADVVTVKTMLGHRSTRTTDRYAHIGAGHISRIQCPFDLLGTPAADVLG